MASAVQVAQRLYVASTAGQGKGEEKIRHARRPGLETLALAGRSHAVRHISKISYRSLARGSTIDDLGGIPLPDYLLRTIRSGH